MSNNTRDTSSTSDTSYDFTMQRLIGGKYSVAACMETAERVVRDKTSSYKMLDIDAENHIPKFQMNGMSICFFIVSFAFPLLTIKCRECLRNVRLSSCLADF